MKLRTDNGMGSRLPGLNLDDKQLFFLKFAQNWCQNMTPEGALNALKTWKHTPGKYRFLNSLRVYQSNLI
jgi:predicted metalloendopeptidase